MPVTQNIRCIDDQHRDAVAADKVSCDIAKRSPLAIGCSRVQIDAGHLLSRRAGGRDLPRNLFGFHTLQIQILEQGYRNVRSILAQPTTNIIVSPAGPTMMVG